MNEGIEIILSTGRPFNGMKRYKDMIENDKLDIEKYIGYMEILSKLKNKNYDYELRLLLMIRKSLDDNTITKEDTYNLINNMA